VFGSGKTYLCELIGAFGGPGGNAKVSYPPTSEEATKMILSLLLTSRQSSSSMTWIPTGSAWHIKRMLTADKISDRISRQQDGDGQHAHLVSWLGQYVGPVRDLLRRVVTIHIDPRCSTPATLAYNGLPVEKYARTVGGMWLPF